MISLQPKYQHLPSLNAKSGDVDVEKATQNLDQQTARHSHHHRSKARLLALFSAIFFGVSIVSYFLTEYLAVAYPKELGLAKRQSDTSTESNDTFIDKKYYLIVIFVGLFLVILAAIAVSAWCCKGAFQNPLCCPCYLCACCGCLSILECIGCGLCCEGLAEVADG